MKSRSRSENKVPAVLNLRNATVLEEAQEICDTERNKSYGEPLDNHQITADLYNAYFAGRYNTGQYYVGPEEVCILNILQKVSRTVHGGYEKNSLVDIAGYAYNIEKVQVARAQRAFAAKSAEA